MKLHTINTGFFKLDGGAMFGVVPKSIWQRLQPADDTNLCTWAMRCLLIEENNRLILVDTGIGNKQSDRFFSHYDLHGTATLESSLNERGFTSADVTDVFLTHLHFDHVGGGVVRSGSQQPDNGNAFKGSGNDQDNPFQLTFPNATYWSNARHWQHAMKPNAREKASFLPENIRPISDSGRLRFIEQPKEGATQERIEFTESISVRFVHGHTDSMMLPQIRYGNKTIVYMADLFPSIAHLPIPYVMAYDIQPLQSLIEKELFLEEAVENDYILFFEHDPVYECCTLTRTEKGIREAEIFKLSDLVVD